MSTENILYLIIIAIAALGIAIYQYFNSAKTTFKLKVVLALLRFMSLFVLGVLLLNPKIEHTSIQHEKPKLVVALDNSSSILHLKQKSKVNAFLETFRQSNLSHKFSVEYLTFGNKVSVLDDSLSFKESHTNLSDVFSSLKEVYNNERAPTVIVTDGNQTLGRDYELKSLTYNQPIYPVVVGDTILKSDLKISDIQLNTYTFLNNEFPVETTLNYTGKNTVNQSLNIFNNSVKVYSKQVSFSKDQTSQVITFNLPAKHIGKQKYRAEISALSNEENTSNNQRHFSIEVVDERTNVLLISDITHPDIGALKNAIESHDQRKVTLKHPSNDITYSNYQLVILYQPTIKFKPVLNTITSSEMNHMIISGLHTDWTFLNKHKTNYKRFTNGETQEFTGETNTNFTAFLYDDIQINSLPPLNDLYGEFEQFDNTNTLLFQRIKGIQTNQPLLAFFEDTTKREALFLGEGIWKWRKHSYLNSQSFEKFDAFIGKIIQYLSSTTAKKRLTVDVVDEFTLGEAKIVAQYVDKNYVTDPNATLSCELINQTTKQQYTYNLTNIKQGYQLKLNHLPAGEYTFLVSVKGTSITTKGQFLIKNFDIEAQHINPDVTKLSQIATNKKQKLYTLENVNQLIADLMTDEQFKPIEKSVKRQSLLINWKYLLLVLLGLLTFEWLIRKYNGLL
ncbi:MAG: vWA domain-containing protein [Flavobacteriaceae bacterium]